MWEYRNADVVLNAFQSLTTDETNSVLVRFLRFMVDVKDTHPCKVDRKNLTRMKFHDGNGDRFVLVLPKGWVVPFRVVPDCSADEGFVEFIDAQRLETGT